MIKIDNKKNKISEISAGVSQKIIFAAGISVEDLAASSYLNKHIAKRCANIAVGKCMGKQTVDSKYGRGNKKQLKKKIFNELKGKGYEG